MYHTIETKMEVPANIFYYHKDMLAEFSVGKARFYEDAESNEGSRIWHCELLKHRGINIRLAYFTANGFTRFFFILRINPKRILNNTDFISVTHESETDMLYTEMNKCLLSIGLTCRFELFDIERIDYCCNNRFEDEIFSVCYMDILKRSCILCGFETIPEYSAKHHRMMYNENVIYAYNKSVIINIYNKYPQMVDNPKKYQGNLEDYRGVIRFEVQCLKPKTRSMRYSNGLPDMRAFHWMKEEFSEKTLLFYLKKIFCSGDYVALPEARKMIDSANFRSCTKDMMLRLLGLANEKRSLQKALDVLYSEGIQPDYLNRLLKKFNELNVNPVTIPLNWGIQHFYSPVKLVEGKIEQSNPQYSVDELFIDL